VDEPGGLDLAAPIVLDRRKEEVDRGHGIPFPIERVTSVVP
jgi:hypothetical protein